MQKIRANAAGSPRRLTIFKRELPLYVMLIPGVVFALVFNYLPMFGLVMAFQDFSPLRSFTGSEWIGLRNFQDMLALPTFWTVVRNTLFISVVKILLRLLVPLILALLLNEVLNNAFKRTAQTVFFLPYFLSWAVMGGVLRELFEYDGTVNAFLQSFGLEPVMFLGSNTWFPIIIIVSDVWKDMGYNMIIFLAAITNVDPALNESAALDGASRWQQIWHVTIPNLLPTIITLTLMAIGRIFYSDFGLFYQVPMDSGPLIDVTSTIDTYVYRALTTLNDIPMASAAGVYQSMVGFILVLLANWGVKKIGGEENALF